MVMRRHSLMLVSLALMTMMLLASGVAVAKVINGTSKDDRIRGTKNADTINVKAGDDVVRSGARHDTIYGDSGEDVLRGGRGNDKIYGGDDADTQYGGRGRDRIFTAGHVRDVVNCGRGGRDWAEVDPLDQIVNCERVKVVEP
jgi:Ca2+-binding RTX toxin-like protein